MSLIQYRLRRNFQKTAEPKPKSCKASQSRFVVQKHDASNLHYDFRLEIFDEEIGEVILKSWAVPKNIPLSKEVKHLAIQTEDHPVEYVDFEGRIPAGQYGAGTVEVWDEGKWGMIKGSFGEGKLSFNLFGEKIKGRYVMILTKGFSDKKRKKQQHLIEDKKLKQKDDKKYWLIWRKGTEIL